MLSLPPAQDLKKRARALAALELIFSPEWEDRYYSYDSQWDQSEEVASMRDGCGNEWWILFHLNGWAALKGLAHESPAWSKGRNALSEDLQKAIPEGYGNFASEPAFVWNSTSFAYLYPSPEHGWTRVNDYTSFSDLNGGEADLLQHHVEDARSYANFVSEYYEREVPVELIESIFNHTPITFELAKRLNPDLDYDAIHEELFDTIGYPR